MTATYEPMPLQGESAVATYFHTFNQGDFEKTAALFTANGRLKAPFEEEIIGRDGIYQYLQREADGMVAQPQSTERQPRQGGQRVIVKGQVKAVVFNVNVAWTFELTPEGSIERVEVKLLASLQELVRFRPQQP